MECGGRNYIVCSLCFSHVNCPGREEINGLLGFPSLSTFLSVFFFRLYRRLMV